MKKNVLLIGCIITFSILSCTEKKSRNENGFLEFHISQSEGKKEAPLSDWLEDCKMVIFEDIDTALFKLWMVTVTDNHILIRQRDRKNYKLFNHEGKFLCDVGRVGNGPGEYQTFYDEIIDEAYGKIYITPFAHNPKVKVYTLDGNFEKDIDLGENLNKPKIATLPNGNLLIIHMAFAPREVGQIPSIGIEFSKEGEIIHKIPSQEDDYMVNFDGEIFSFNNTDRFSYLITSKDTFMVYNPERKVVEPLFRMKFNADEHGWILYNETPRHFIADIMGGKDEGLFAVDKRTGTGNYINLKNDFWGNIEGSGTFNRGWYTKMFEPEELIEKIEERVSESDCSESDRQKLQELRNNIDIKGNNIMFFGKLKK